MIVTASTVKDTLPNIERFVAGNLANGVDHMFVFLDAPDPEVRGFLDSHEHVTAVRTDKTWWHGERPHQLNDRQRINANVVKVLLSCLDWAEWLFHIDADEIALIDRAELARVPAEQRVVRLEPLEAVSQMTWEGDPTYFKRLLGKGDLTLLQTLGVLERASNGDYFHGHVDGKVGLRPCLDLWLTLHQVVDADRNQVDAATGAGLQLLHYESWSGDDFVRKWTSILAAGPLANFRPAREPTAVALQTLIKKGLSEEQTRPYLMRIFERTTLDDLETLRDLDLLEEHRPLEGTHTPAALPTDARETMEGLLARLHAEPKQPFRPGAGTADVEAMLSRAGVTPREVKAGRRFLRRS
ncbi:glycosyltransferase family 2 protein [Nocardioides sp.]|uniref:glycosyltransferase family 2 protein n=1 Tax=Nocardioides sp. TaxID=35761 RepID=UPI0027347D36|nr:glycosyltransferase family 2 protein [Nocardioides sp.]MDP3893862.1 glycosyltransferase family 2 protein [Nocardioides sp.]